MSLDFAEIHIFRTYRRHTFSPVTGSSKLLYSSRVGQKSEILLLCPLEDENQSRPTLFQHFPVIEAKKIAKNLRFAQH